MDRPTAAVGSFPYPHRNLAEMRLGEVEALRREMHWEAQSAAQARRVDGDEPLRTWRPVHVHRDPCAMCGVRGDVGCKHRGVA